LISQCGSAAISARHAGTDPVPEREEAAAAEELTGYDPSPAGQIRFAA
jgi:hypothetical protein